MTTQLDCLNTEVCQVKQDQLTLDQNQQLLDAELDRIGALTEFEPGLFFFVADTGIVNAELTSMLTILGQIIPDHVFIGGDNFYGGDTIANIKAWMDYYIGTKTIWPAWGNHDFDDFDINDLIAEFSYLPGNRRYYSKYFAKGNLELFVVSSDNDEPDGIAVGSVQEVYMSNLINNSTARWKVGMFHHPPMTPRSGSADGDGHKTVLQWPSWQTCDLLLTGHGHLDWYAIWNHVGVANCSSPVAAMRNLSGSETFYGGVEGDAGLVWGDDTNRHVLKLAASQDRLRLSWHRHQGNPGGTPLIDFSVDIP